MAGTDETKGGHAARERTAGAAQAPPGEAEEARRERERQASKRKEAGYPTNEEVFEE